MKPFNLEEAKQGKPVQTRDGRDVRVLAFDRKNIRFYLIVALVSDGDKEHVITYREDGRTSEDTFTNYDLFMKSEKKEGWINIYPFYDEIRSYKAIFNTEQEALIHGKNSNGYITTIKVEWEE